MSRPIILVGTFTPADGGIARALRNHAETLERAGFAVHRVDTGSVARAGPNRASLDNLAAVLRDSRRTRRAVRSARAIVVGVHTTGTPLLPALRAVVLALAARSAGSPVVVHLHSSVDPAAVSSAHRRCLRLLDRLVASFVVLDPVERERVAGVPLRRPVEVVPNSLDLTRFPTRSPRPSDGRCRLIYVGAIARRKGLFELVEAVARLRGPVTLEIVGGPGPEGPGVVEELARAVAKSGIGDRVTRVGSLPADAVVSRLGASDVFVLPSHMEGQPLALMEAMASGLACVASDVGAVRAMLAGGDAGVVVRSGDVDGLVHALDDLVADPARRLRLGVAARAAAEAFGADPGLQLARVYRAAAGDS